MLTMTNHNQQTIKPLDMPVSRYVLKEQSVADKEKRKPEFELTSLNPK